MPKYFVNLLPPKATIDFSTSEFTSNESGKLVLEKRLHYFEIIGINKKPDGFFVVACINGYHIKAPDTLDEILGTSEESIKRDGKKEESFEIPPSNVEIKGNLDLWFSHYYSKLSVLPESTSEAPSSKIYPILREAAIFATNQLGLCGEQASHDEAAL